MSGLDLQSTFLSAMAETPTENHRWGRIVWLASGAAFPGSGQTLGYVEINPGQTNYRHRHPNCEEVLLLLEGSLDHWVGDQIVALRPGSVLSIGAGVVHWATNASSMVARMIVAYPTGHREIELVEVEVEAEVEGRLAGGAP